MQTRAERFLRAALELAGRMPLKEIESRKCEDLTQRLQFAHLNILIRSTDIERRQAAYDRGNSRAPIKSGVGSTNSHVVNRLDIEHLSTV